MKRISFIIDGPYFQNRIFDLTNSELNRDDALYKFYQLREAFLKRGYDLSTSDINTQENSEALLFFEMPRRLPLSVKKKPSFLILSESPVIKRDNYDVSRHAIFRKIFTWNGNLIGDKYIKLFPAHRFPEKINVEKKEKLCTLVVSNKRASGAGELYSERHRLINWMNKNHPDIFDLYGMGWGNYHFGRGLLRPFNAVSPFRKVASHFMENVSNVYRGVVRDKRAVLSKYKFTFAYENYTGAPGYITEKIFDPMFSGSVPVYRGAPDIANYVPDNCYINANEFSCFDELFEVVSSMEQSEYECYMINAKDFLSSPAAKLFDARYYGERVADVVCNNL